MIMRLFIDKYYLIKILTNPWIDLFKNQINVMKYLGTSDDGLCFSTDIYFGFPHNGRTYRNNCGENGYCIHLEKYHFEILKRLTPEEVMIERL